MSLKRVAWILVGLLGLSVLGLAGYTVYYFRVVQRQLLIMDLEKLVYEFYEQPVLQRISERMPVKDAPRQVPPRLQSDKRYRTLIFSVESGLLQQRPQLVLRDGSYSVIHLDRIGISEQQQSLIVVDDLLNPSHPESRLWLQIGWMFVEWGSETFRLRSTTGEDLLATRVAPSDVEVWLASARQSNRFSRATHAIYFRPDAQTSQRVRWVCDPYHSIYQKHYFDGDGAWVGSLLVYDTYPDEAVRELWGWEEAQPKRLRIAGARLIELQSGRSP